jgi:glyoxylase-like metal-dependent hydrolase (beta-lactamase superfamily II)
MTEANGAGALKPADWTRNLPRPAYRHLTLDPRSDGWFSVYRLDAGTFAIYEDGQYEESICYLLLGTREALLIDTGNGIGNLRAQVRALTDLPIRVANTHCHIDHVGSNYLFDQVAAFDDDAGIARRASRLGYNREKARTYIGGSLVWKPWPPLFDPETFCIPPYTVGPWLREGDVLDLGGRELQVLHTPGHSPDSVCFLDAGTRMLFLGDLFYTGQIYTWLPGGDLELLVGSYDRLVGLFPQYDLVMPAHNEPAIGKEILLEVARGARQILDGTGAYTLLEGGRRRYGFERFAFVTGPDGR